MLLFPRKVLVRQACKAVKRPRVSSIQDEQDANRDQFAWIELRLCVLRVCFHCVIDKIKNLDDTVLTQLAPLVNVRSHPQKVLDFFLPLAHP